VDDKQDHRDHQQQVDEPTRNVEGEPRDNPNDKKDKRQNEKNVAHIPLTLYLEKIQQI
jgi:hypothetical protein